MIDVPKNTMEQLIFYSYYNTRYRTPVLRSLLSQKDYAAPHFCEIFDKNCSMCFKMLIDVNSYTGGFTLPPFVLSAHNTSCLTCISLMSLLLIKTVQPLVTSVVVVLFLNLESESLQDFRPFQTKRQVNAFNMSGLCFPPKTRFVRIIHTQHGVSCPSGLS